MTIIRLQYTGSSDTSDWMARLNRRDIVAAKGQETSIPPASGWKMEFETEAVGRD
jgi:hypothetical protein